MILMLDLHCVDVFINEDIVMYTYIHDDKICILSVDISIASVLDFI